MNFEEVDPDEVEKEVQKAALTKPRSRSKNTVDTSVRTVTTWFHLPHNYGTCDNPNCNDPRPSTVGLKTAMRAEINGEFICRYCFISGYGLDK